MAWASGDALTSANLNNKSGPWFNVMDSDYGAVGDGVTDDTAAIQAAATAANAAGGGSVFFPAGVYLLSSPIDASSFVAVRFEGQGYGPVTAGGSDTLGSVLQASSAALTAFFNVSGSTQVYITRFRILATNAANTTVGIHDDTTNSNYLTIRENHFRYFGGTCMRIRGNVFEVSSNSTRICNNGTGHILHLNLGASDGKVMYNDLGSTDEVNGDAIFMDGTTNGSQHCLIAHNMLFNCRYGINLTNASINNRILGNRCEKHGLSGIRDNTTVAASYSGNLIEGNSCFNNTDYGILLQACKNTAVIGNRCFYDSGTTGEWQDIGIRLTGAVDCQVIGNRCFDAELVGIRLDSSSFRNLIADNYIRNVEQQGILVQDTCSDNTIRGNYIYLASQETTNTYDGILLNTSCNDNIVESNTIRGADHKQAINVNTSNCNRTRLLNNDLKGGWTTAAIRDVGTATERRGNWSSTGAMSGRAVLVNGTVTVSNAEVLATDNILLTRVVAAGTTRGVLTVGTIVAGTSFVIQSEDLAASLSADDDSTILWEIVH